MLNPFTWIMDYINDYTRYYRTMQELNGLDERELRDIGLSRCEIPFVAMDVWRNARIDHLVYG